MAVDGVDMAQEGIPVRHANGVAAKIIIHSVWIVARLYPRGNSWRLWGWERGLADRD